MYIITNALKNIGRNKGRNILLAFIMLAIIGTTVVTLTITNTADSIIDTHQEQFSSRVMIQPDIDAVIAEMQLGGGRQGMSMPRLTIEEALALAASNYVQDYRLTVEKMATGSDITSIGEEEMNEMMASMGGGGFMIIGGDGGAIDDTSDFIMPNLRFIGGAWLDDFDNGERVLHEGDFPQADSEVLISLDLAELNSLTVGDSITLNGNLLVDDEITTVDYHLTITGIYLDFTPEVAGNMLGFMPPTMNPRNEILTSLNTVLQPLGENIANATAQIDVTYYLANPSYLEYFEAEARAMGVSELLLFSSNAADFYAMVAPVEGLRSIAQTFLIVVLVLGGIILVLLSSIFIRERKYEIGVLRAMGMKRQKVAMGLWSEMLVLTATCLVLGLGIGSVVAQPVSDTLLVAQVEATASIPDSGGSGQFQLVGVGGTRFGTNDTTEYNPIDQLDLSLSTNTILQIAGISFALMTVAAVTSTVKITKYEPIKILMERD